MKIAVIGAGVVGICTAYELAQDGHTVSVFERNAAIAEEASFASAPHLSPSLSHALAWPAWPQASRLRSLLSSSGIRLCGAPGLRELRWLLGWKTASTGFVARFTAAQQLAAYSLERLRAVAAQNRLGLEQSEGQLLLVPTDRALQAWQERLTTLRALGVTALVLTPEEARRAEPALGLGVPMVAAIHFPGDGVANCRQFAHLLRDLAMAQGVSFQFGTDVTAIRNAPGLHIVISNLGAMHFDRVVLCAGTGAAGLLGRSAPLTVLWSHALSAPVREPLNAPRSAVLDQHSGISVSRTGARLRASGAAELGGTAALRKGSSEKLYLALQTLFPGSADFSRSLQLYKGASVFSPDGLPMLGPSARPGVWLNLAHGHNGWSMAMGAARILADQIGERPGDLDTHAMLPARLNV